MADKYVKVKCLFHSRSINAVQVDIRPDDQVLGELRWIARSLIHGIEQIKIDNLEQYDEFTFRLMEWKARELGL